MANDLHLIPNDIEKNTQIFEKAARHLHDLLKDFAISIEHIGSTAIAGTIGKGIIDLMIFCESVNDQEKIKDILSKHFRQGELHKKPDGRLFFCNNDGQTQAGDVHIHLVVKNSKHHETVYFRDYLRTHPEAVTAYNKEKMRLANETNNVRAEYTRQKTDFIQGVMEKISQEK